MSLRQQFDPADWDRIVALPMLTGMAVTAADPGGLWGAVKESAAMAGAVTRARSEPGGNALVDEVVAGFATSEGRGDVTGVLKGEVGGRTPAQIVEGLLAEIERLATLVAAKAPAEAEGFKAGLMQIATSVAEAGTEGGFLGFGGTKVSPEEAVTLDRLRKALGMAGA